MKILGIGVDIIENKRIKEAIKNKSFINRVYSVREQRQSNLIKNKVAFFSKRFAAKEAFSKALGTGFRMKLNFKDIEVHAGHGLDYKTTKILTKIKEIEEFNIGHFIIGESIFYGLPKVIKDFKKIIKN